MNRRTLHQCDVGWQGASVLHLLLQLLKEMSKLHSVQASISSWLSQGLPRGRGLWV